MAWIETGHDEQHKVNAQSVATREGGVDRNNTMLGLINMEKKSPPARVAWIETLVSMVV